MTLLIQNLNQHPPPASSSAESSLYRYKAEASAKERDPPEFLLSSSIRADKLNEYSVDRFSLSFSRFYLAAERTERNGAGGFCLLSSRCIRKVIVF